MTFLKEYFWLLMPLITVVSAGLAWLLIPVALRIGLMDHPGERKVHETQTPLVGGLAVYVAWSAAVALSPVSALSGSPFYQYLLAGAAAMLVTGLLDDLHELAATLRFLIQIAVCLLMTLYSGARLEDLGQLFSGEVLGLAWLAIPVTVFAALGVINSFNLIDGLDGLSGALFIIAASGMALFASLAGYSRTGLLLLFAIAAVLGFLLLNARFPWNERARVFLGDAGSLMLGFVLAWCFIRLGSGADRAFMPMTAVWLFAVPLLDTATLIWRRWREGRPVFSADQQHLHHAFLRAGFSVGGTWSQIVVLALVLASVGIAFEFSGLPDHFSFYTFMGFAFSYYFYLKHSWASQRFLGRHFIHHDFDIEEGYA